MKKIAFLLIFIFSCSLAMANEIYELNHRSKTSPDIVINRVEITSDSTIVYMTYTADYDAEVGLHRADSPLAFVILDASSKRVYSMIGAENINIRPRVSVVKAGRPLTFKVIFEKIDTRHFHVIEGRPQHRSTNETFWDFSNIKLPKRD